MSRRRLEFRLVLGVLLVWSAWPTVASALDTGDGRSTHEVATAPSPSWSTIASVPTTVSPSTTVSVPPTTAVAVTQPPATDPPSTAPPDTAPAPPPTDPPVAVPEPAAVEAPVVAAAAPPGVCDAAASDIVNAMNRDRAGNGVAALCANTQLTAIAQAWADHLAQTGAFEHQDLWGVVGTTPFRAMAENLLRGASPITPDQMEAAWMASPGHRVNILNGTYLAAGVGLARGTDGRLIAVVEFGGLLR